MLLPQGTPLARTEAVTGDITAALERINRELTPHQPGGAAFVEHVSVRYNYNPDTYESGPHVATVTADLLGAERRSGNLDEFINEWREQVGELPDVIALHFNKPGVGPAGRAIDIRLSGPDLQQLKDASLELQAWLQRYRGVFDLGDDLRPGKPELRLTLKDGALALDLNARTIAAQLRAAFFGITAYELQLCSGC